MEQIIKQVARQRGTTPEAIRSKIRKQYLCDARREIYLRARAAGFTFEAIAKAVNKDHSTVVYAVEQMRKTLEEITL